MARRGVLNDRERLFVREYLADLNATQAAIRAGYSPKSASKCTYRIFKRPRVKAAVGAAMAERAAKLEITAERVLRELALLGFANVMDYFTPQADGSARVDLSGLTRDQAAAIREVSTEEVTAGRGDTAREVRKVRIKLADKKGNLELIGKHLGLFGPKDARANVNGEEGERRNVKLSNEELHQRIVSLLAGGEGNGTDTAGS